MGTEERKSQQLKLEQRYSWDWEPAPLSSSSLWTPRVLGGCRGTPEQPDPGSALPPSPHRCEPQPRSAPAAAQPWSSLRKEARRVRFQLDKAPPEAEGSPWHPGNGRPLQPLDRAAGENELRELEEKIQEMRDQLRAALLRKSELVSVLGTTKGGRALPAPLATEEAREER